MTKPLGNEDLSSKPGERVIDKPELPRCIVHPPLVQLPRSDCS